MSQTDLTERGKRSPASDKPGSMSGDILGPHQRQLGRYSLLRELRRSRDSVTLLALDPVMHREVVLKVVRLPPPHDGVRGGDAETHALEQAFVRQAQAAGRLQHPHIVTVYEAARVHELAFLAIERVNGRPLHELLASGWRPEPVHCASLTARIADAIEYAHSQSIAHGHLGPQHVVLQPNGTPRVEGFGGWIDGGAAGDEALAHTEKLLPYFQNELTDEMRHRDVRAVVVLLHMMLTGKPPQFHAVSAETPPSRPVSILALRPDTPTPLAQLIDEVLDPTSSSPRRTAADVRDALTAYLWNARKAHVAPATIGIPLAAPPEPAPDFPTADLALIARPRGSGTNDSTSGKSMSSSAWAPTPATITRTITGSPSRNAPPLAPDTLFGETEPHPPEPEEAAEVAHAQATSAAPLSAPLTTPLTTLSTLSTHLGQWVKANRLVVMGAAALIFLGIAVGVLLGRNSPIAQRPEATTPANVTPANATGIVNLDIQPWGEIFVDGKPIGVSPPLTEIKLSAGPHAVEIRHGDKAAISAQVDVNPTRAQIIRHRFN